MKAIFIVVKIYYKKLLYLYMKKYDAIIVGSGPSGIICAQKLVDNKINTLVLDYRTSFAVLRNPYEQFVIIYRFVNRSLEASLVANLK